MDIETDRKYMLRCIELAKKGIPDASPNPTVGAVIVYNGKIIGEGYHRKCGGPHAEVNAVNSVKDKSLLSESTIYVTLEPCSHYGKTPPCADMLIRNKLKRVVIGCIDPFSKVHGNGIKKLKDAGIDVTIGVCESECRELIKKFTTFHTNKRPYIILKWAQSSDGFIDKLRTSGEPIIISNPFTQILVHKMRSECDAIMIGTNTALLDNPSLTTRKWAGNNPVRIVFDRSLRLPKNLKIFDRTAKTIIFTEKNVQNSNDNIEYVKINYEEDILYTSMKKLYERNIQSLLVEGGAKLLQSFINNGLWDETIIETGKITINNGIKAPILKNYKVSECRKCFDSIIIKCINNNI